MKLNNKGMTIVELLVTFSLLLVIVVGMFNLIMDVKFELDNKQVAKDFTEYSATMNNEIHYDLLKNKPFAIAYRNTNKDAWQCASNISGGCTGSTTFTFKNDSLTQSKTTTDLTNMCSGILPCAVYAYKSGSAIAFKTIGLNKGKASNSDDLLKNHGVKYNDLYESIPHQEYVEVKDAIFVHDVDEVAEKHPIFIGIRNNIFVIDFPYFLIEHDKNYGFKIAYPFKVVS